MASGNTSKWLREDGYGEWEKRDERGGNGGENFGFQNFDLGKDKMMERDSRDSMAGVTNITDENIRDCNNFNKMAGYSNFG